MVIGQFRSAFGQLAQIGRAVGADFAEPHVIDNHQDDMGCVLPVVPLKDLYPQAYSGIPLVISASLSIRP